MSSQCNLVSPTTGLSVLIVDDEPGVVASLQRILKPSGYHIHTATSGDEALTLLKKHNFAVIITDSCMPGISGVDLLRYVNQYCPQTVSVMLSGQAEFSMVVELLNNGLVNRYLAKPWDNATFISEIELAITQHASRKENQWSQRVQQLSDRLNNEPVELLKDNVVSIGAFTSLIVVKVVNADDIAHHHDRALFGQLLEDITARIRQNLYQDVRVNNEGGGLFAIYMKLTCEAQLESYCHLLRKQLQKTYCIGQQSIFCHIGIGFKSLKADSCEPTIMVKSLEMAILKRINSEVVTHPDDNAIAKFQRQQQLRTGMQNALKREQFKLAYQPKVSLDTGLIEGAEMLLRWQHDNLGWVAPGEFVKLAELDGQMETLGDWVIRSAVRAAAELVRFSPDLQTVAINISARQLQSATIIDTLKEALHRYALSPGVIELELNEITVSHCDDRLRNLLWQLKLVGVRLAIDDFGSGYTSLSELSRLPLDTLKLDKTLIDNVDIDPAKAEVVTSVIATCHKLGICVVAEGVESVSCKVWLAQAECDYVQGFVFSKAVNRQDFEKLVIQQPFQS